MACRFLDHSRGTTLIQQSAQQVREFEGTSHSAQRCEDCGHVFFPAPAPEVLNRYYSSTYPEIAASSYNAEAAYADTKVQMQSQAVLTVAAAFGFGPGHHFHEIGCAFGGTVDALNRKGLRTTGTELNEHAVRQGRDIGNHSIFAEPDVEFFRRSGIRPDVVYGFHVLEHMADPVGYLRELGGCIGSESIVVLFVPNAMALFPTAYGFENYIWFAYPAHLNLFSPHSALCAARSAGFEVLKVTTNDFGIEPEATAHVLGASRNGVPVTAAIHDHLLQAGLLQEELVLVLTQTGSAVADRYADDIKFATRICETHQAFESRVRRIGTGEGLPFPPSAAVTDAVPRTEDAGSVQDLSALLLSTRHRAEQAEIFLASMQNSTFWRATAAPRKLIGWLNRDRSRQA